MLEQNLVIAGLCALVGLAVIRWVLRQATTTRIWFGIAYLVIYSTALIRAGILPVRPAPDTVPSEVRVVVQALQLFWWYIFARCLIALGRAFLLFKHKLHERKFASDLLSGFVYLGVLFAVVSFVFELPVTGLIATSGVVAIVLGLALQSTVSDLFSGIALSLEGAYRIGDSIGLEGDIQGTVIETNWRATHIMTWAQDTIVIPNSVIAKSRIVNYSFPTRVHGVKLAVSLDDQMAPARGVEMLEQAVASCRLALRRPPPSVQATMIGAASVDYAVSFFVDSVDSAGQATTEVLDLIQRQARWFGVSLARQRQDLRVIREGGPQNSRPTRTIVDRLPLAALLSAQEKEALLKAMKRREFGAGDTVFEQGSPGDALFLVDSGVVSIYRHGVAEGSEEISRLGPGDSFGEDVFDGGPHDATVRALTRTILYEIPRADVIPLLTAHPELQEALEQALAEGRRLVASAGKPDPGANRRAAPQGGIFERIGKFLTRRL
jgi:small-conductance mechanosensitive channel/CRP-like cAMP-binding protein